MKPLPIPSAQFAAKSALFLALAVLLPVAVHALGDSMGRVLLPMHIPVLLAGFLVGPASGLLVGVLAPVLSHLVSGTGMPPVDRLAPMSLELAVYGLVAGLAYCRLRLNVYVSLIIAMIVGRLMFGAGQLIRALMLGTTFDNAEFWSWAAMTAGLPGIMIQLVLIPILVAGAHRKRRH